MELGDDKHASARAREFGRVTARLDELDLAGGERVGGASRVELEETSALETRLEHLRPMALEDWRWLAMRLARAIENGWHGEAVKPLLRLAD